ncbi:MAG: PPOX class F420-dependent oxidoreductase [Halobacteriaceae archaeon]
MSALPDSHVDLFETTAFGHLATLLPNGAPHVTPVWIDHDGDTVLVNTATGRRKERNVRDRPQVGLSVVDPENPYRWLSLWGGVERVRTEGAVEHIHELSLRYTGERYDLGGDEGERVVLQIDPEEVLTGG